MPNIIDAKEVWKSYGKIPALRGLSITLESGILGLVGPNGSGKTTFIRTILGLVKADTGNCKIFGLDSWKESLQVRKRVGVLHERPYYTPSMTVGDYVKYSSRIYGRSARTELIDQFGLERQRRIKSLSAGMYRKLGLIQALACDPELVILDEPTSNLDPIARLDLLDAIIKIHQDRKISFLISSHVLSEIERVATETSIIYNGKLVDQGKPTELVGRLYKENIYHLTASDPAALLDDIRRLSSVEEATIAGDAIIIHAKPNTEDILWQVTNLARGKGIKILEFARKAGLEEVLRRVVTDQAGHPS